MLKGLILAGGRGKRVGETTNEINKCMIEVAGKPLLENSLDYAIDSGVEEVVLVVGYKAEDIINHYGISFGKKRIRYVIQREQKGLVHAIECAREALENEDFFLMLGDEVMQNARRKEMIQYFNSDDSVFAACGILSVSDLDQIRRTYALVKNEDDQIFRLIEKPRRPINHFQGTGHCIFRNRILEYIDLTPIHHERGERELPDLIQCCIDDGKIVKAFDICDQYGNINSKDDLLKAEGF